MRAHRNHQQYAESLSNNVIRWLKRKSRRLSQELLSAALILMGLDLEPEMRYHSLNLL